MNLWLISIVLSLLVGIFFFLTSDDKSTFKAFAIITLIAGLHFAAFIIYIAIHFINKYW